MRPQKQLPGSQAYWEWRAAAIDHQALEVAWNLVIKHHDIMRTRLAEDGQLQILSDVPPFRLELLEGPVLNVRAQFCEGELEGWPLFRAGVSRQGEFDCLHVVMSYLLFDAASQSQLWDDLGRLYRDPRTALRSGHLARPRPTPTPASRDYWLERLDSLPGPPELPASPARGKPRFVRFSRAILAPDWQAFQERCLSAGVTPLSAALVVIAEGLACCSSERQFCLALTLCQPTCEKRSPGDHSQLSLLEVSCGGTLAEASQRMSRQLARDLAHRDFDGLVVLGELCRRRSMSFGLLPVAVTSLLGTGPPAAPLGEFVEGLSQTPQVLLDHRLIEGEQGQLLIYLDAAGDRFPPGMLDALLDRYQEYFHLPWNLPLHPPASFPAAGPRQRQLLHSGFLASLKHTPDRPAVEGPAGALSYRQLHHRACQFARKLSGVKRGAVAIFAEPSADQLAAQLGVLYVGLAYLPLDPALPLARVHQVLEGADPVAILAPPGLAQKLDRTCLWPEHDEQSLEPGSCAPEDLAYIIYTSGSTGNPKGVMIAHQAAANTLISIQKLFSLGPHDRSIGLSSPSFDLSVFDSFGIWGAGGCLVLPLPARRRDPEHWKELVDGYAVSVWNSVPALWEMFLSQKNVVVAGLKQVWLSGDWIPMALAKETRERFPDLRVISLGGATEAAIWSIYYPLETLDPSWSSIPYGRALPNQGVKVVDPFLEDCLPGVPGDIVIQGAGVAEGYWKNPQESEARFRVHPQSGNRLYLTGDRGRYLSDGCIEILGRSDLQVKIRGHRIELTEIEATLRGHSEVKEAVAVAVGERCQRWLAAFVVPPSWPPERDVEAELRDFLTQRLPEGFVPSKVLWIRQLPLSSNGKVDRSALAELALVGGENPLSEGTLTEKVAQLWSEMLHGREVAVTTNFFGSGGDSLAAVRMAARLKDELGFEVPLSALVAAPTLGEFVARLVAVPVPPGARPGPQVDEIVIPLRDGRPGPNLFLFPSEGGHLLWYPDLIQSLPADLNLIGFQAQGLSCREEPLADVASMASLYLERMLQIQPDGPYNLGGYSAGGVIALEVAQRLRASGRQVGVLFMADSYYPLTLKDKFGHLLRAARGVAELTLKPWLGTREANHRLLSLNRIVFASARRLWATLTLPSPPRASRALEAIVRATSSYRARPYAGRVLFFTAREETLRFGIDNDVQWERILPDRHLVNVNCRHVDLLKPPFCRVVAQRLGEELGLA